MSLEMKREEFLKPNDKFTKRTYRLELRSVKNSLLTTMELHSSAEISDMSVISAIEEMKKFPLWEYASQVWIWEIKTEKNCHLIQINQTTKLINIHYKEKV